MRILVIQGANNHGGGPFRRRRFGAADSALDNSAPDISAPFPNFFLFFEL